MSYGKIYETTWWGNPVKDGWGNVYYDLQTDNAFRITVDTTQAGSASDTFVLPLASGETYNFTVAWGDGSSETITSDTDVTHVYSTGGTYQISITGTFPRIYFNNTGDKDKLIAVKNLGVVGWTSFFVAFYGCSNLETFIAGNTDTSGVTNMTSMLRSCTSLTILDVSNWDVSSVTNMVNMFQSCTSLTTLDVSNWDVSSVTSMYGMFRDCTSLTNIDVSNWDVSSVLNMIYMFYNCPSLTNIDVSSWDVSSVTRMDIMFYGCTSLTNIDVSSWDVSSVTDMSVMFYNCDGFDNNLSLWDITAVTNFTNFMIFATGLSTVNYDATLIGWEATLQAAYPSGVGYTPTISINFGGSQYTAGGAADTARQSLINNFNWTIVDGGSV